MHRFVLLPFSFVDNAHMHAGAHTGSAVKDGNVDGRVLCEVCLDMLN